MFLSYVTGWGYSEIMDMEHRELYRWVNEAYRLHNLLNPSS